MTALGPGRILSMSGLALFCFGLVLGFFLRAFPNSHAALTAHLNAVQSGTFLIALGLLWPTLNVWPKLARPLAHVIWIAFWGLEAGLVLAAFMPDPAHTLPGLLKVSAGALQAVSAVAMLAAIGALLLTFRSKASTLGIAVAGLMFAALPFPDTAQADPIRAQSWVEVPSARLYLLIRGDHASSPALLWLHGGPGAAERPLFRLYDSALEQRFVVAYLDQRGAGRSFDKHADPAQLTVSRHLADLDAVVDHLMERTQRRKVILVGHSWGSQLGLLYSRDHADKVAAFIGVSQVTSTAAAENAERAFLLEESRKRHDSATLARTLELGLPPYSATRRLELEHLADEYGALYHQRPSFALAVLRAVGTGIVSPWEIARIIQGNNVSLEAMNAELLALDLTREVTHVDVPVAFMLGRYDRHTDSRLAANYFSSLAAPRKKLVWLEHSAHNAPFEEPEIFVAAVAATLAELGVLRSGNGATE